MQEYSGHTLSPGYAKGRVVRFQTQTQAWMRDHRITECGIDTEISRFETALQAATAELGQLKIDLTGTVSEQESEIFSSHQLILNDPRFVANCRKRVTNELMSIERAVEQEVTHLSDILAAVQNEVIRGRSHDVRDAGRRLLRHLAQLLGHAPDTLHLDISSNSVVVTSELLPSDVIKLGQANVRAILTERGGSTSHSAILARSMAIPMVTGLKGIVTDLQDGDLILVDAVAGRVIVDPGHADLHTFCENSRAFARASGQAFRSETNSCMTRDGMEIELQANIESHVDADLVLKHHLAGVGLFRTECLFMTALQSPTLEQHMEAYSYITDRLHQMPVVVRTLDVGAEKLPLFMATDAVENPLLGRRGLAYSLSEEEMFRTQLRAIVRSAQSADLRILFPMVLGIADVERAIAELDAAMRAEGVSIRPKVGTMIETPASVLEIEGILKLVDFVSIGTNDLTQFILATDRSSLEVTVDYSVLHPAVIKAIFRVLHIAWKMGKYVCICGEAAGDPATAALLIGLGARSLSMSPVRAARVRQFIGVLDSLELAQCAHAVLASRTPQDVKRMLDEFTQDAIVESAIIMPSEHSPHAQSTPKHGHEVLKSCT